MASRSSDWIFYGKFCVAYTDALSDSTRKCNVLGSKLLTDSLQNFGTDDLTVQTRLKEERICLIQCLIEFGRDLVLVNRFAQVLEFLDGLQTLLMWPIFLTKWLKAMKKTVLFKFLCKAFDPLFDLQCSRKQILSDIYSAFSKNNVMHFCTASL